MCSIRPKHATTSIGAALLLAALLAGCASGPPEAALTADRVEVRKSERKLTLIKGDKVVREYRVALGKNPYGHKEQEGDNRTPEGDYVLNWRNPNSSFHRSINISYPNEIDRWLAETRGVRPGGLIMIHGMPNYVRSPAVLREYEGRDWTNGCIAVQNHEMDEIWAAIQDGTPIRILP
jgi:murein L,D-transpeptidase YafK